MLPRLDRLDQNYFINGGMEYWQRLLSDLVANGTARYVCDRWLTGPGIDGVAGSQTSYTRDTDVPTLFSKYSIKATGTYIAGEEFSFAHRVESIFSRDLSNNKVSLAFDYKSEQSTQVRITILTPNTEDVFSINPVGETEIYRQTHTILNDSSWHRLSIENISLPDMSKGCHAIITFITNNTGTVNHWIAEPKLNIGETAQGFSIAGRNLTDELRLCQRYLEKSYNIDTPLAATTFGGSNIATGNQNSNIWHTVDFLVTKRVVPTVAAYSPNSGTTHTVYRSTGGDIAVSAYLNPGVGAFIFEVNGGCSPAYRNRFHWSADCEL